MVERRALVPVMRVRSLLPLSLIGVGVMVTHCVCLLRAPGSNPVPPTMPLYGKW